MASVDVLCGICEGRHITKLAGHWCPECEEGLCSECKIHHGLSKFTKRHDIILIENFKKLPKYISANVHHCQKHEKAYTNYCPHHESFCCPVCVEESHNKCVDFLSIDNFLRTAKSSALLETIIESIALTKRNLYQLLEQQDQNLLQNKQHRQKVIAYVKIIRSKINSHLDELEQQILKELLTAEEKIKLDINKISTELRDKKDAVEELERDVVNVKQFASDLQTCIGSMTFKDKVDEIQNCIIGKKNEGKLIEKHMKCNLSDRILSVITAIKSFGTISVEEKTLSIDLIENRQRAQITNRIRASIGEVSATLIKKWNVPKGNKDCDITGHVIRPDGKIILVDREHNERALVLTEDGKLEKEIKFSSGSKPNDITSVDDNTICVSFHNNRLEMIDTATYKTIQVIKTSNPCCGVRSYNGNLIWYEQRIGIQMKHKSSDIIKNIVKDESEDYWSYLTMHSNKIYQTNLQNHTITCYKVNGEKVWEFKDENIISQPWGIAVDNLSNMFIGSLKTKIVMVADDRKQNRQILGKRDGLDRALALYFDRNKNTLLVSNTNGEIFFYNIS